MKTISRSAWLKHLLTLVLGIGLIIGIAAWLTQHLAKRGIKEPPTENPFQVSLSGLTQAEALQNRSDHHHQIRLLAEKQARRKQLFRRIFSIFNLKIFIMAVTQVFLGSVWGAVTTLVMLLVIIFISERKRLRSARQVSKLLAAAQPKGTVIREGQLHNIDQHEIVIGDVLVVGAGDEIIAGGTILESSDFSVDNSPINAAQTSVQKLEGDRIDASSFCESGWAVYRVEQLPDLIRNEKARTPAQPSDDVKTPLEKSIQAMLLVLLGIAGVFYGVLILEMLRLDALPPELINIYRQAISTIFSIAPSGLFFMILLNYGVGSAQIASSGALVRRPSTIEALAQTTTIALVRKRNLDALTLQIDMIPDEQGDPPFSERRTRRMLGNYFHSVQTDQFPFAVIKDELEGARLRLSAEARFFSLLGWEAINFDAENMPGTYVIGYPEILQNFIDRPQNSEDETNREAVQPPALLNRWGTQKTRGQQMKATTHSELDALPGDDSSHVLRLMFAYAPGRLPPRQSTPQPPNSLIPICYLNIVRAYHPDIKSALGAVQQSGVSVKILSRGQLQNLEGLAKELNLNIQEDLASLVISGDQLDHKLASNELESIREKIVFYQLNTEQMVEILDLLRADGQFVVLNSNAVADLPLMAHTDVSITSQGSSHKVITKSDVILMDNSPAVLPEIFRVSQIVVQNVINLLKLNLTKITYVLLLILAMFLTGNRKFIFEPLHGSLIGIFTITLPSIFISLWSHDQPIKRQSIRSQLFQFVIPVAFTIALAVIGTYLYFYGQGYHFFRVQHIITHLLVLIGLLLVVFCYPPALKHTGGNTSAPTWRLTGTAAVLLTLFITFTYIRPFQYYFRLFPLVSLADYLIVAAIGAAWALLTVLLWRFTRSTLSANLQETPISMITNPFDKG